jgi:[acyl-carrier-protein] S-malonyltransferase
MKLAFVFPGQGSQSIGMLAGLAAEHAVVVETFQEAGDALDYNLWALTQNGSEEELNQTARTQPAMLAAGVAVWRVWNALDGVQPSVMAGHSLGEYSALVCAGSLDFADAIRLVEKRGQLMQAAVPAGVGAMAAILGLGDDAVRQACADSAQGDVVEAVNFNAPGQVVIAGSKAAVERAAEAAKAAGAKRAVLLPVSVPSHSSLMMPAAERFAEILANIAIQAPSIPVINNVDVKAESNPSKIREALVRQLHNPVRWVETIRQFAAQGVETIVESGPGKVLVGLNKRIVKEQMIYPVLDAESLAAAQAAITQE